MERRKISILKFGGTSINSEDKLQMAYKNISREISCGYKTVTVVSAFRGVTDLLSRLSVKPLVKKDFFNEWEQLHKGCEKYIQGGYQKLLLDKVKMRVDYIKKAYDSLWAVDELLSIGESYSTHILYGNMTKEGVRVGVADFDQPDFPTLGNGEFGSARIDLDSTRKACEKFLKKRFKSHDCMVVPGMGCVSPIDGRVRVRRGASDYVATSLAYGLMAKRLWILSDVNGLKSADSNIVKEAKTIPYLTVGELLDAGALGGEKYQHHLLLTLDSSLPC